MVGYFGKRSTRCRDHPDVGVVAAVEFLAGAIGYKRNARGIGRPLGIGVVPIVAGSYLAIFSGSCVDYPQMAAFVVEPAGVIELVIDVPVVADIAFAGVTFISIGGDFIAWARAAHCDESFAIRRPLKRAHAVFQMAGYLRFAAIHIQDANLWMCWRRV